MANNSEEKFLASIHEMNIPILVLDQKWHHLFHDTGKPAEIEEQEKKVSDLLAKQGALHTEVKDLKATKAKVMENVMQTMDKSVEDNPLKGEEARLIDEINERLENAQDELLDLPKELKAENETLMLLTMNIMYDKLHEYAKDSQKIKDWITNMRIELKKNIIRKQNMDLKNQEIYNYMHDIYGAKVLDLFDVKFEEKLEVVDRAKDKTPPGLSSEEE